MTTISKSDEYDKCILKCKKLRLDNFANHFLLNYDKYTMNDFICYNKLLTQSEKNKK